MQKIKFQIKGMHCQSCSTLIEERLKDLDGVESVRVSFDSQKVVVVYNEEKLNESAIQETIKDVGDYTAEKIEDVEKEKSIKGEVSFQKLEEKNNFSRPDLSMPISIIIAGLVIGGAIMISGGNINIAKKSAFIGQIADVQDLPSNQEPTSLPNVQPSTIQTFEITKDNHIRGDFSAPITLVEFSDFECPFCERFYPTVNKLLDDYKGKVRLVYKHFPLGFHPNAQKAAESSECADEQGKFWGYHDKLFENQPNGYSLEKFKQWAKDLELNSEKFNNCLDSGRFAQKIQADYQEGAAKGVNGTPATFINGQLVSGALPYESFKQIIDSLLE